MLNEITAWVVAHKSLTAVSVALLVAVYYNRRELLDGLFARFGVSQPRPADDDGGAFVPLDDGYTHYIPSVTRTTMFTWLDEIRSQAVAAGNVKAVATANQLINDLFTFDGKSVDAGDKNP